LLSGRIISLIAAPVFIATKLEAFHDRGGGDFLASHDLEDIVTVVDGRPGVCTSGSLLRETELLAGRRRAAGDTRWCYSRVVG